MSKIDRTPTIEEMAVLGCTKNPQAHTAEECLKCEFKNGMCDAYSHTKKIFAYLTQNALVLTKEELNKNYISIKMYELAKAFHDEKCAEFEKLCYDYHKLKRELEEKNKEIEVFEKRIDALYGALEKACPIDDAPWCEGWTSPDNCDVCPMVKCNCNPRNKCNKPAKELTIHHANAFKVKLEDGTITYIEEQEHCDIWWKTPEYGVAGRYMLEYKSNSIKFNPYSEDEYFIGTILAYSHDYGKIWVEV